MDIILGLLIPFIGTTAGASMVFFMKNSLNKKVEKLLLGFASGVMIAASIWSLLIPAIEMAEEQGKIPWIPAAVGFVLGILFLLIIDWIIPYLENKSENSKKIKDTTMLILAVTLHNIPERDGSRCCVCRIIGWKFRNHYSRSICSSNWNCCSKFSRRCNYFYATKM